MCWGEQQAIDPAVRVIRRLRERADSYSRDALVLADEDHAASIMLASVRDELRKVADELEQDLPRL